MKWIYRLFVAGTLISFVAMIVVVSLQVFSRYFLSVTPHWTEEAARIFFIYTVAFGTGIGMKNGDFLRLDLIGQHLSPDLNRSLDLLIHFTVVVFSAFLTISSIQFIILGMDERSPALELTMGFVFFSLTLVGMAILFLSIIFLFQSLKVKR